MHCSRHAGDHAFLFRKYRCQQVFNVYLRVAARRRVLHRRFDRFPGLRRESVHSHIRTSGAASVTYPVRRDR